VRDPRNRRLAVLATTVAGFVLVASPAVAAGRDGLYRGRTSQDRKVRLVVDGRRIEDVRFSVFHEACGFSVIGDSEDAAFRIDEDDTFEMRFFGDTRGDKVIVRGEFTSRRRAEGRMRSVQDDRQCRDIVRVRWSVERVDGST
jgi:hypothetical protein